MPATGPPPTAADHGGRPVSGGALAAVAAVVLAVHVNSALLVLWRVRLRRRADAFDAALRARDTRDALHAREARDALHAGETRDMRDARADLVPTRRRHPKPLPRPRRPRSRPASLGRDRQPDRPAKAPEGRSGAGPRTGPGRGDLARQTSPEGGVPAHRPRDRGEAMYRDHRALFPNPLPPPCARPDVVVFCVEPPLVAGAAPGRADPLPTRAVAALVAEVVRIRTEHGERVLLVAGYGEPERRLVRAWAHAGGVVYEELLVEAGPGGTDDDTARNRPVAVVLDDDGLSLWTRFRDPRRVYDALSP